MALKKGTAVIVEYKSPQENGPYMIGILWRDLYPGDERAEVYATHASKENRRLVGKVHSNLDVRMVSILLHARRLMDDMTFPTKILGWDISTNQRVPLDVQLMVRILTNTTQNMNVSIQAFHWKNTVVRKKTDYEIKRYAHMYTAWRQQLPFPIFPPTLNSLELHRWIAVITQRQGFNHMKYLFRLFREWAGDLKFPSLLLSVRLENAKDFLSYGIRDKKYTSAKASVILFRWMVLANEKKNMRLMQRKVPTFSEDDFSEWIIKSTKQFGSIALVYVGSIVIANGNGLFWNVLGDKSTTLAKLPRAQEIQGVDFPRTYDRSLPLAILVLVVNSLILIKPFGRCF